MRVGVLGSGVVAKTLASGFLDRGHEVALGTRSPTKLQPWVVDHPGAGVTGFAEAAAFGELLVLAVKGSAAKTVLELAGSENLDGKVVIDATNPIADGEPVNGVLPFFTGIEGALMEDLQHEFPGARFVKAFNSVGSAHMVDPQFGGEEPTMFICGNDEAAKATVREVVEQFGWECADMGMAEAARAIEPLCILWCIPGFLRGEWGHAFKLLRQT